MENAPSLAFIVGKRLKGEDPKEDMPDDDTSDSRDKLLTAVDAFKDALKSGDTEAIADALEACVTCITGYKDEEETDEAPEGE